MTPKSKEPEHLPILPPPGGPAPGAVSRLGRLLRYRFFLVGLVIIIFFAGLFTWESRRPDQPAAEAQAPAAQAPAAGVSEPGIRPDSPAPGAKAPEAAQAAPEARPAPAPPVLPPREPAKGEIFTRALIKIMDDQLNHTWFGWRPNSMIFGKLGLTDNVNHVQLGVLEVARRTVEVMNVNLTRFATTEAYNPQVNEAMDYFMVSADKYWFPSASGKYREALGDLETYIEDLHRGRSRFYSRVDNLIILFGKYKDLLGSDFHNLIKDSEADGSPVSWWVSDNYFYHAQGTARGMAEMLEGVNKEFHQELLKKNSHRLLEEAIHALHQATHLHPWMVTNGSKDGFIANHRANMATYIGEAEHLISTLQLQLATN